MLTEAEALQRILDLVPALPGERVPLSVAALNRVAAGTVHATVPLPGFDNSSMDGYAVLAAETGGSIPLKVVGEQPAGPGRDLCLEPGCAIRIFTGAPVPEGADAVIMQEDVDLDPATSKITCREPVERGENIRRTGSDLCQGQKILTPGSKLTPAVLGVLGSQGLTEVSVHAQSRVAVVTTGDELVPAGQPLASGQLYNSNGLMLEGLVRQAGIPATTSHHLPDDLQVTTAGLADLIETNDFIILSGGVSVGDHDCIKPALAALGHESEFWRVKIKPGKPLLLVRARRQDGGICHVFGLPGNPVSSFVTFLLFVRPALLKAMGLEQANLVLPRVSAQVTTSVSNRGDRPHYIRGFYERKVRTFTPLGVQQSHALFGLSQANALLRMEADEVLTAGAMAAEVLLVD